MRQKIYIVLLILAFVENVHAQNGAQMEGLEIQFIQDDLGAYIAIAMDGVFDQYPECPLSHVLEIPPLKGPVQAKYPIIEKECDLSVGILRLQDALGGDEVCTRIQLLKKVDSQEVIGNQFCINRSGEIYFKPPV